MSDNRLRILLIEDSPTQTELLKGILTADRFAVESAGDLASGIDALEHDQVDVVLVDLGLPDSSGVETLVKLRSHAPALPMIVLTATEDETTADEALQKGAQDFLIKGKVDGEVLIRSIRYAIDRKRAQQALQDSDERFHLLVDGVTDYAIFLLDPVGNIVSWNTGAERITGYCEEEIVGKHFSCFYTPEDIEQGVPEKALRLAEVEGRIEDERWRLRKDGSRFFANIVTTALRSETGQLRGFSRVARDMTERKKAEEILREKEILHQKNVLVELLQAVTVSINVAPSIDDALLTCLIEICAHTGWPAACANRVVGASEDLLAVHKVWFFQQAELRKAIPASTGAEPVTFGVGPAGQAWARGELVWLTDLSTDPSLTHNELLRKAKIKSCLAIPVFTGGTTVAILEFFSSEAKEPDQPFLEVLANLAKQLAVVLDRRRLEEVLLRQAEELARSNAELQEFAKIAAHDLQEPLRAVQGFVELLARRYKGKLDKDADRFMRFIEDAVHRMIELIQGVLEHSGIGSKGKLVPNVDCAAVLGEVTANLTAAIQESDAQVTWEELPPVTANRLQMVQLFQNLISNAIKFRGPNPPQIHISAEKKESNWVFAVRDNGIGIDERYRKQIFGMFTRLHGKTAYPGTGIGLAICKKIVEYHSGSIWVESQPGLGSTFFFTLPADTKREGKVL